MENRLKFLAKNIFFLTLSNFATKILSFLLVPLYTNILSTEEYGSYDFFSTSINLLIPILTIEISSAVFRFAMEKNNTKNNIFSIGCKISLISIFIIILFVFVNSKYELINIINEFKYFFIAMYTVSVINNLFTGFTRALERMLDISISSVIGSTVIIILNIIFLIYMKMGLQGYFIANIAGLFIQNLYLFLKVKMWQYIGKASLHLQVLKEMIIYSAPLVINSIAWWINSASDKYIIIGFCGMATNGIYAVASKIPSILNIFQNIFAQAWGVSAIKEFEEGRDYLFFKKMYSAYNFSLLVACSILIILDRFLAKILYSKDFFIAWKYVPFLLMSIMFGALSGYLGSIFSAMKDSKMFAKSTCIGATINLIINICFVPIFGAMGAAIATLISYIIVLEMRMKHIKKNLGIPISGVKDYFSYIILLGQALLVLMFQNDSFFLYLVLVLLFLLIIVFHLKELKIGFSKIEKYINYKLEEK